MICDHQPVECRYTFSDEISSLATVFVLLHMEQQSISYFEYVLFFRLFYLLTRFLSALTFNLLPSSSFLYYLFPSFWRSLIVRLTIWHHLFLSVQKKWREGKKRKKARMANAKLFCTEQKRKKGTWPLWTAHIKQKSSVTLIRTTAGWFT